MLLQHLTQKAKDAYRGISFSPEQRGERVILDYSNELQADIESIKTEAEKYGVDAVGIVARYQERYERHFVAWLHSKSNCISSFVTGPSNFPTRSAEKRNQWETNKYNYFRSWREKVLKAIKKSFRPKETPLTELDKAKKDLAKAEKLQDVMKQANAIIRKAKGTDCIEELKKIMPEAVAKQLLIPDSVHGVGFASYSLVNNGANIRRLKERVKVLSDKAEKHIQNEESEEIINGVKLLQNFAEDRVQLYFDGRPEQSTINTLKKNGWRWSPSQSCWQRKITQAALSNARYILNYK